jgi:hypothetical protein
MYRSTISRRTLLRLGAVAGGTLLLGTLDARASRWERTRLAMGSTGGGGEGSLTESRIRQGLKEALRQATTTVVKQVGQQGGYLQDPAIHIPLPGYLETTRSVLGQVGAAGMLEDLEVRLNRAAEQAAPRAREPFLDAIAGLTLQDAREILNGPDDAATRYFQRTMTPDLKQSFRPVVDRELENTGAIQALDRIAGKMAQVPFAGNLGDNAKDRLTEHGVEGALNGIFHYLGRQEAAIRQDPAQRTTDLLREVFG